MDKWFPSFCCAVCCTEQWLHWTIHRILFIFSKIQPHPGKCHTSASSMPTALSSGALRLALSIHLGSKSCKVSPLVYQGCSPCKMNPKPPFFKQITWLNCPWLGSHICFRTVLSQIKGGRNSSKGGKEGKKREKEKKAMLFESACGFSLLTDLHYSSGLESIAQ